LLDYANEMDVKDVPMLKSMTAFAEALQARGRYTFTQVGAMNAHKRSDIALKAAQTALKMELIQALGGR